MNPQILLAHESFVRSLARKLVADHERAEDIVQNTWLAALTTPPRLLHGGIRGWLRSVVRNFAKQEYRAAERKDRRERTAARGEAIPSAQQVVEIEAVRRRLVEAVLALDEQYRSVILMRFYGGMPPRFIAKQLGLHVEAVRTRIKRGLLELRSRLGGEGTKDDWFRSAPLLALMRIPFTQIAEAGMGSAAAATGVMVMKAGTKAALVALGVLIALSPLVLDWVVSSDGGEEKSLGTRASPSADAMPSTTVAASREPESAPAADVVPAIEGPKITGVVQDAHDRPVVGASIVAFPATINRAVGLDEGRAAEGPIRRALSGAGGRFVVTVDASAPLFTILADAPGYSPGYLPVARASDDIIIRLDAPCALTGFVRDLVGRPVVGARVTWLGLMARGRIQRTGASGPDGSYRIEGLPSRAAWRTTNSHEAWIQVLKDGFAPMTVSAFGMQPETQDPEIRLDLYLPQGATLKGRVLDAETRAPIPGAPVVLWATGTSVGFDGYESPYGYEEIAKSRSDERGGYIIARIPAEGIPSPAITQYDERGFVLGAVGAMPPGYVGGTANVNVVRDGDSLNVDILCWPAARVEGRVIDAAGLPFAGAVVQCRTTGVERRGGWFPERYREALRASATTDAQGRYVIEGCAASSSDSPGNIEAFDPAYSMVSEAWSEKRASVAVTVRAGVTTKAPDLVIMPFPSAVFQIGDEFGNPIGGATLDVTGVTRQTAGIDGTCSVSFGPSQLKRAADKPIEVLVAAPGYATSLTRISVPLAGEIRVTLRKGRSVAGRVLTSDGSPATRVRVLILNGNARDRDPRERGALSEPPRFTAGELVTYGGTSTLDDGTFQCADLPDGPYEIRAIKYAQQIAGEEPKSVEAIVRGVSTGTRDVLLRLPEESLPDPTGELEALMVDARTREPVLRSDAFLLRSGRTIVATTLAPGRFRFDPVPLGRWKLSIRAKGYGTPEQLDVEISQTRAASPMTIALHAALTLQGTVVAPPDTERAKLRLIAFRMNNDEAGSCTVEADGTYRIADLAPGSYRIGTDWFSGGSRYTFLTLGGKDVIVLRPGESVAVRDLTFSSGGYIIVKTTSPRLPGSTYRDLQRATDAQLGTLDASRAEIMDSRGAVIWSGAAQDSALPSFAFPPGTYTVKVWLTESERHDKVVVVKSGEVSRVLFEFE